MKKLRDATLVILIKKSGGEITNICLAMKKRGFGAGRYNGVGGKVERGETVEQAAIRETEEEIGVRPENLQKVAQLSFYFESEVISDEKQGSGEARFLFSPNNQKVHVYFSEQWQGEITESEEMKPKWFKISQIPFEKMWPDDILWLPEVLKGKLLKAMFKFGKNDIILEKKINKVNKL